ncbi:MAG TPA: DUF1214 domain-containing protein [Beijerinckiaceae bacterium]
MSAGAAPAVDGALPRPATKRRAPRRTSTATLILYALAVGAGLGLSSAYLLVRRDFPIGGVRAGPWVAWPRVGSREADPYARAIVARRGEVPLGVGEGLAFTAATDSAGQPLTATCEYRIGSVTPPARYWTLTLYDQTGRPALGDLGRAGFTSGEIMREADGRFAITLARDPAPGNWLRQPAAGPVRLVLRLYDTPVAAGSAALDAASLPAIERGVCAP